MNSKKNIIIRSIILVPVVVYSIWEIFLMRFVFSFLSQSGNTPYPERLTHIKHLLPLLLTIGFIIYQTLKFLKRKKMIKKPQWILNTAILMGAFLAVSWQIDHLLWQNQHQEFNILKSLPYLLGLLMTIWTILELLHDLSSIVLDHKSKM